MSNTESTPTVPAQQLTFLDLPGCTLTKRTLAFPAALPDAQLPQVGSRLLAIRGCIKWALGSLLSEMTTRRTTDPRNPDETWTNEFAEAHDIDPKERREIIAIHTFFPPDSRTHDLTYEHYKEAMLGVGDGRPNMLKRALAYLQTAAINHWSHTELRRHIRSAQAAESPDTMQTEFTGYGAIFDFRRYMQKEAGHPITPERAKLLLNDIGPDTLRFIDELRTIVAQGDGGK